MPNPLTQLTDAYEPEVDTGLPVANPYRRIPVYKSEDIVPENKVEGPSIFSQNVDKVLNALFRDDEKRLQLWPEKVVREGPSAAHDIMQQGDKVTYGLRREDFTDIPYDPKEEDRTWLGKKLGLYPSAPQPSDDIISKAQSMAALAGTGGLGSVTDATLGATPFLRPALKYKDRLYKGKEGQQHMDVIPEALYPEFQKMAMSGEDISHYNFGFVNDKGHFLDREKALKYAVDTGMVDKFAGQYGALTSTMELSKPQIEARILQAPATKIGDNVYVGKPGQGHLTLLDNYGKNKVKEIYGEDGKVDWNKTKMGFIDNEGNFIERSEALKIAENNNQRKPKEQRQKFEAENRLDARDVKYPPSILTNQLLADSSKPGMAIEALKQKAVPAIKNVNGDIVKGKRGETHEDLFKRTSTPETEVALEAGWEPGVYDPTTKLFHNRAATDLDATDLMSPIQKLRYLERSNVLNADSTKPGMAIEAMGKSNAPTFYSAVEHNLNKIPQSKMTGDQWLGTLSNKPGVKPEELDWTGLRSFLEENKGKPVTKADIEQHLAGNKVELKEVNKGGEIKLESLTANERKDLVRQYKEYTNNQNPTDGDLQRFLIDFDAGEMYKGQHTKYNSYQLPGGENYREMLLTLPNKKSARIDELDNQIKELYDRKPRGSANFATAEDNRLFGQLSAERNQLIKNEGSYKSSHWDEPNILAHVRMNDRDIGGKKSLHLEEIQSDWHQQGRDKGYKTSTPADDIELINLHFKNIKSGLTKAEEIRYNELKSKSNKGVPDAPFKKNWHELALKRMIREASEKGYDRLSWTPGEAQAARYDLSKSIDNLQYKPETGELVGFKNGKNVVSQNTTPEKLADVVGKEAAEKLLKSKQTEGVHKLIGEDLKIGGEGMKGFYDQIIPKALEKLGKEHGIKVQSGSVNDKFILKNKYGIEARGGKTEAEAQQALKDRLKNSPNIDEGWKIEKENNPVHYIDIPQSLRDTALHKGFPLFSGKYMFAPVDYEPEFKK